MFGYGYDYDSIEQQTTIYVHDTWSAGDHTFTWSGYYSGLGHWGVMALTPSDGDACSGEWDHCYKDTSFTPELQLNIEAGIIRGQAVLPDNPAFPAPITGKIYNNKALFAINYLGDGLRFYQVNMFTGAGTTWGIWDSGEYYDSGRPAQIVGCGAKLGEFEIATGAPDETAASLSGGDLDVNAVGWKLCYYASDFPAELLEFNLEGAIIRGQCTSYPAPLTGYLHSKRAFLAIGYLNDNMRFYDVSTKTASGRGWAITGTDSSYYDPPHNVKLSKCSKTAVEPGAGDTGDGS